MAVSVTNRKSCQSLQGESVIVKLDATDSGKLGNINVGMKATVSSSSKVGYVNSVDKYGHSFNVSPEMPTKNLDSSSTRGYLNNGETITVE